MATTAISVREYLATSYRPDRDYVDGEVLERNLGEREHGAIQIFLGAWFFNHRDQWKVAPLTETRTQVKPASFRIPDVCLVAADAPFESVLRTPPLLCVEIMSPQDRLNAVRQRLQDFVDMGVHDIWVIDPESRRCYTCVAGKFEDFTGDTLRIAGTEIHVPLALLWAELDR